MLSQKVRYGLRALVELARAGPEQQLTAAELAARADAPRKFLEAILLELSRRGLILSRRGKFGGYTLAKPAADISFADVIRVIDGPLALAPCVSQTAFRKCDDCADLETCALRPALRQARDATAAILEAYSLQQAVDDSGGQRTAAVVGLPL
jgi:Rrf2 family protein